ncbi:MAG: diguanylate cyclase [Deltaproteobacteria bacterium]|nr:diguanylate cyclase [Deltaproteobacteria bacterium]
MQFVINRIFIFPSFINLEKDEAIRNINRVSESINKEIRHLDALCHDWGAWDDSYDFMNTGSQEYINGTLTDGSFITANLNLIYYLDTAGKRYWGKMYDPESESEIKLEGLSAEDVSNTLKALKWDPNGSDSLADLYLRGIMSTAQGPIILAARPILTSENIGPARGTLIMGRFLSTSILDKLKDETKVNFNLHEYSRDLPLEIKSIMERVTPSSQHIVKEGPEKIFMYDPFLSIHGTPAFLIEVVFPREITLQGLKSIKYSLFSFMVAGFIILFSVLILIKVMVIKPLLDLSSHIEKIEEGKKYDLRIGLKRKDAIGKLAHTFDHLISKIESQTIELEKLSSIDGLTGINNRRIFDETLVHEWKRIGRQKQIFLSAIMCDVDFFKMYNDHYGHQKGDECLRRIAEAIKSVLKRPSDFLARYGGEEFVVLLPNTSPEGAQLVAEDIRKKVHGLKIRHEKSRIDEYVTLSLGVSTIIPGQDATAIDLIKAADQALYECKDKGRNRTIFKCI